MAVFSDPLYVPSPFFLKDLRKSKTDILHIHNIHTLLPASVAPTKVRSQKLVLQPHYHRYGQTKLRDALFSLNKILVSSLISRSVDRIIVNSKYEEMIVREDFPNFRHITLVPEGISLDELKSIQWRPAFPQRILHVGSLRRYKNVDKLIEAFKLLLDVGEESKLVIIGYGPERNRLIQLANKLELDNYIEWKHGVSKAELFSEYAKAGVFVSLSYLESFSRVICEALAVGVPVVALRKGPLADYVKGGFAIGVESTEKEEVAAAILRAKESRFKPMRNALPLQNMDHYSDQIVRIYESMRQIEG